MRKTRTDSNKLLTHLGNALTTYVNNHETQPLGVVRRILSQGTLEIDAARGGHANRIGSSLLAMTAVAMFNPTLPMQQQTYSDDSQTPSPTALQSPSSSVRKRPIEAKWVVCLPVCLSRCQLVGGIATRPASRVGRAEEGVAPCATNAEMAHIFGKAIRPRNRDSAIVWQHACTGAGRNDSLGR